MITRKNERDFRVRMKAKGYKQVYLWTHADDLETLKQFNKKLRKKHKKTVDN